MAAGRVGAVIVAVLGTSGFACAHLGSRPEKPTMAAGKYAVESIRSRAQLDGIDQVIEISEQGTKLVDSNGAEHVLTERGALLLSEDGACRLALAVSVDGEEPGVSDRACTWQLQGDQFLLGDYLLVAPVITEDATEREVYLPAGAGWRDAWTGALLSGGQRLTAPAPLSLIPVYVRDGGTLEPFGDIDGLGGPG